MAHVPPSCREEFRPNFPVGSPKSRSNDVDRAKPCWRWVPKLPDKTFKSSLEGKFCPQDRQGDRVSSCSKQLTTHVPARAVLREHDFLGILLQQLKSSGITIVSNACSSLWNFSARCPEDQNALREMGAVPMLKSLTQSKHKTIANSAAGALRNLTG